MPGGFSDGGCAFVKAAPGRDIKFTSNNRFDSICIGLFVKINRTEHIAVVCDGHGRHGERLGLFKQVVETDHAVKKAVLCMNMKMNKISVLHF